MDEVQVAERLAKIEQDTSSIHRRLDAVERLTESIHSMTTEIKAMRENMNSMNNRLLDIERRPRKHWETVVTALITAVVGILVGRFL